MRTLERPLVWLRGELRSPPLSRGSRMEAGVLLRRLQSGESIGMPASRPMPSIGKRCHELRVRDVNGSWRVIYRIDEDAIVILDVFAKTSQKIPKAVVDACRRRLRDYDAVD